MMQPVTLIAEVASNAGGSLIGAQRFVEAFSAVGANILKFQLTRVAHLRKTDPQYDWFAKAEWSLDQVREIVAMCAAPVVPMFTVYHPDDVPELVAAGLTRVKIGAGEAHDGKLAAAVLAQPFVTLYVSEGIRPAHASYRRDARVKILGTCSHYPAPRGLVTQRFASGHYDGWSDHAVGLDESHLAVLMGATVIERHVQLRAQAREPRAFESTVEEFAELRRRVDHDPDQFLGRWSR